jgi:protein-L-isoaspartate O-methyltransferase
LGNIKSAPYDKIFIFGSVVKVPNSLFDQLSDNGSLITVIKNKNNYKSCGNAVVFKKNKDILVVLKYLM